MDILQLFNLEGEEESVSTRSTSSLPDTVSLNSEKSPSDSELSDYEDYPGKPSAAARELNRKRRQPSQQISHSYFRFSFAVVNTLEAVRGQCCGYEEDVSMLPGFSLRPRERWSAFERKHSPDRVSIVVEVSERIPSNP